MTSLNENTEDILRKIREKIENKFSKKFTDNEILEKCLMFSKERLDDVFTEKALTSKLVSEKIKEIISHAKEYQLYDIRKFHYTGAIPNIIGPFNPQDFDKLKEDPKRSLHISTSELKRLEKELKSTDK